MKWLVLLTLVAVNLVKERTPVVRTGAGLLRGTLSDDGRHYQYYGIPYGTVDARNRFQAPLPPPAWEGVLDAVDENTRCPQRMAGSWILGEEDCLRLNIYTPIMSERLLPVMVYIHGGCFFEGTGGSFLYGGDYFVRQDVIFVSVNYRLNIEGFLCLGIEEAPGNAGLKDQIAALKWVHHNIRAFGGDPGNVTLFGESAGAVSTSFLILSPLAKGLFHRAILQSGATLAPWAMQHDPIATASALAKALGYDTKDPHHLYDIFKNRTIEELINARASTYRSQSITSELLFVPCVEREIPGVDAVITEHPADVIKSKQYNTMPMIIGFNDNEGIYFVSKDYGTSLNEVDVSETLQPDLEFGTTSDKLQISTQIERYYFGNGHDDKLQRMIDLYSDLHFKYPSAVESELYAMSTDEPIYFYLFKYNGLINMPKMISGFFLTGGASHADELFYMFKPHSFPLPHRFLEQAMIKRMLTMWTNFAKYGEPTPSTSPLLPVKWRPNKESNPTALVIDATLSTSPMWDMAAVNLWNSTYNRFRRRKYTFR